MKTNKLVQHKEVASQYSEMTAHHFRKISRTINTSIYNKNFLGVSETRIFLECIFHCFELHHLQSLV